MRTTPEAVAMIIEVDASIPLAPFIETSNALITEICVPAGYDDTRLELIERYLAAHFYAVRDPRTTQERAGPVAAQYESQVDLFFAITRYGQQALLLDTAGGLAKLNTKAKTGATRVVGVNWLGSNKRTRNTDCPDADV